MCWFPKKMCSGITLSRSKKKLVRLLLSGGVKSTHDWWNKIFSYLPAIPVGCISWTKIPKSPLWSDLNPTTLNPKLCPSGLFSYKIERKKKESFLKKLFLPCFLKDGRWGGTKAKREKKDLLIQLKWRSSTKEDECSSSHFKLWGLFSRTTSKDQITRSVSIKFCWSMFHFIRTEKHALPSHLLPPPSGNRKREIGYNSLLCCVCVNPFHFFY